MGGERGDFSMYHCMSISRKLLSRWVGILDECVTRFDAEFRLPDLIFLLDAKNWIDTKTKRKSRNWHM